MSRTKSMGGLGLEGLVQRNTALLGKQLWRSPREQPFYGFWLSGASLGFSINDWDSAQRPHSSDLSPGKRLCKLPLLPTFYKTISWKWQ